MTPVRRSHRRALWPAVALLAAALLAGTISPVTVTRAAATTTSLTGVEVRDVHDGTVFPLSPAFSLSHKNYDVRIPGAAHAVYIVYLEDDTDGINTEIINYYPTFGPRESPEFGNPNRIVFRDIAFVKIAYPVSITRVRYKFTVTGVPGDFFITLIRPSSGPPRAHGPGPPITATLGGSAATRYLPPYFFDPDGDTLTYSARSQNTAVAAISISDGTLIITPVSPGATTVTATARDPGGGTAMLVLSIIVNPPPPGVVAFGGGGGSVDAGLTSVAGTLADSRGDPATFTAQMDVETTYGTFSLETDGNWDYRLRVDDPGFIALAEGANGQDTIRFDAEVGEEENPMPASGMVIITVTGRNDAPEVEVRIGARSATAGGENIVVELDNVFSDPDTGDVLTFTATSSDTNVATASVSGPLTVTPVGAGAATITVTATDSGTTGLTVTETFDVTVNQAPPGTPGPNAPPVAPAPDAPPAVPGFSLSGPGDRVFDRDRPIEPLTLPAAVNNVGPVDYSLTGTLPPGLTYAGDTRTLTGTPTQVGEYTLTYSAIDTGTGNSDERTFTITVRFGALARQYLQTTSTSVNETALHIVNTANEPQFFTGSLYARSGEPLGEADQSLGLAVAPNGRLILGSADMEAIFGISPWRGPAMLEVAGIADFSLLSRLRSPSGLVSNTNCMRESNVLNIEGSDSPDRTYVRFINVTDEPLGEVRGALYDAQGELIGNHNAVLLASLAPKAQVWLDRDELAALVGVPTWTGEALLVVAGRFPQTADGSALQLLNLNLVPDLGGGTFFNFSCFEDSTRDADGGYSRVYLQTTSTSPNVSLTHLVNTSALRQRFTGTLYAASGEQLGPAARPLHEGTIRGYGRLILSSADLERIFGVSPWAGPAMLAVKGSEDFALMTKLRSPSGLVSNTNCVRRGQVHNILGTDSADSTFIRFINIGEESLSNVRGALYDGAGEVIGNPDVMLLASLAPKAQVWLDRDELAGLAGDTWQGTASLVITPALASLRLLNLNLVNSETWFNFSCYEEAR